MDSVYKFADSRENNREFVFFDSVMDYFDDHGISVAYTLYYANVLSASGDLKKDFFATDWLTYSQKEYLGAVKNLELNTEEKELVLWRNSKEIFNLEI
jgi:predicted TIM-barrel fold metal-dependent hydrolase